MAEETQEPNVPLQAFNPYDNVGQEAAPPKQGAWSWLKDTAIDLGRGAVGTVGDLAAAAHNNEVTDFASDLAYRMGRAKSDRGQYVERHPDESKGGIVDEIAQAAIGLVPYVPLAVGSEVAGAAAAPFTLGASAIAAPAATFAGLSYGAMRRQVREAIRDAPEKDLWKSDKYQELRGPDGSKMSDKDAREVLYDESDTLIPGLIAAGAGAVGGGIGHAVLNRLLGRAASGEVADAVTSRVLKKMGDQYGPAVINPGDVAVPGLMRRMAENAGVAYGGGVAQMAGVDIGKQQELRDATGKPVDYGQAFSTAARTSLPFAVIGGAAGVRRGPAGAFRDAAERGQRNREAAGRAPPIGTELETTAAGQLGGTADDLGPHMPSAPPEKLPGYEEYEEQQGPQPRPGAPAPHEPRPGIEEEFGDQQQPGVATPPAPEVTPEPTVTPGGTPYVEHAQPWRQAQGYAGLAEQREQEATQERLKQPWGQPPVEKQTKAEQEASAAAGTAKREMGPTEEPAWGEPPMPAAHVDTGYGPEIAPAERKGGGFKKQATAADIAPEASLERYQIARNEHEALGAVIEQRMQALMDVARTESKTSGRSAAALEKIAAHIESKPHLKQEADAIRKMQREYDRRGKEVEQYKGDLVERRRGEREAKREAGRRSMEEGQREYEEYQRPQGEPAERPKEEGRHLPSAEEERAPGAAEYEERQAPRITVGGKPSLVGKKGAAILKMFGIEPKATRAEGHRAVGGGQERLIEPANVTAGRGTLRGRLEDVKAQAERKKAEERLINYGKRPTETDDKLWAEANREVMDKFAETKPGFLDPRQPRETREAMNKEFVAQRNEVYERLLQDKYKVGQVKVTKGRIAGASAEQIRALREKVRAAEAAKEGPQEGQVRGGPLEGKRVGKRAKAALEKARAAEDQRRTEVAEKIHEAISGFEEREAKREAEHGVMKAIVDVTAAKEAERKEDVGRTTGRQAKRERRIREHAEVDEISQRAFAHKELGLDEDTLQSVMLQLGRNPTMANLRRVNKLLITSVEGRLRVARDEIAAWRKARTASGMKPLIDAGLTNRSKSSLWRNVMVHYNEFLARAREMEGKGEFANKQGLTYLIDEFVNKERQLLSGDILGFNDMERAEKEAMRAEFGAIRDKGDLTEVQLSMIEDAERMLDQSLEHDEELAREADLARTENRPEPGSPEALAAERALLAERGTFAKGRVPWVTGHADPLGGARSYSPLVYARMVLDELVAKAGAPPKEARGEAAKETSSVRIQKMQMIRDRLNEVNKQARINREREDLAAQHAEGEEAAKAAQAAVAKREFETQERREQLAPEEKIERERRQAEAKRYYDQAYERARDQGMGKEDAETLAEKEGKDYWALSPADRKLLEAYESNGVTSMFDGLGISQKIDFQRRRVADLEARAKALGENDVPGFVAKFMADRGASLVDRMHQLMNAVKLVRPDLELTTRARPARPGMPITLADRENAKRNLWNIHQEMRKAMGEAPEPFEVRRVSRRRLQPGEQAPLTEAEHVTMTNETAERILSTIHRDFDRASGEIERISDTMRLHWETLGAGSLPEYGIADLLKPGSDLSRPAVLPKGAHVSKVRDMFGAGSTTYGLQRGIRGNRAELIRHFMRVANKLVGHMDVVQVSEEQMSILAGERKLTGDGNGAEPVRAFYDPLTDRIFITHDAMAGMDRGRLMVHEVAHALTETAMERYPDVVQKMEEIRAKLNAAFRNPTHEANPAVRLILEGNEHGLDNVHEFISEFWANDSYAKALDAVDSSAKMRQRWQTARTGTTLLTKLVDTVKEALKKIFADGSQKRLLNDATVNALDMLQRLEEQGRPRPSGETRARAAPARGYEDAIEEPREMSSGARSVLGRAGDWTAAKVGSIVDNLTKLGTFRNLAHHVERFDPQMGELIHRVIDKLAGTEREQQRIAQEIDAPLLRRLAEVLNLGDPKIINQRMAEYVNAENYAKAVGDEEIGKGANSWIDPKNPEHIQHVERHAKLKPLWDALHPEQQDMIRELRKALKDRHEEMGREAFRDVLGATNLLHEQTPLAFEAAHNLARGKALTDEQKAELTKQVTDEESFKAKVKEWRRSLPWLKELQGVFYPMMRHGDYMVHGTYDVERIAQDNGLRFDASNAPEEVENGRALRFKFANDADRDAFIKFFSTHDDYDFHVTAAGKTRDDATPYAVINNMHFSGHESARDASNMLNQLRANPYFQSGGPSMRRENFGFGSPLRQLSGLNRLVEGMKNSSYYRGKGKLEQTQIEHELYELALRHMLSESARSKYLERRYTKGASENLLDNVYKYLHNTSYTLAELRNRPAMREATNAVDNYVRTTYKANPPEGMDLALSDRYNLNRSKALNEMHERLAMRPHPHSSGWLDAATNEVIRATNIAKLGGISFHILNSTEPILLGLPQLAGALRGPLSTVKAANYFRRAYALYGFDRVRDMGSDVMKVLTTGLDGVEGLSDHLKSIRERVQKDADGEFLAGGMDFLHDTGYLHRDAGFDVARFFNPNEGKGRKVFGKIDEFNRSIGSAVEAENRVVTATAALWASKDMHPEWSDQQHYRFAQQLLEKSAGNYAWYNKPGWMQSKNPLVRMATQFKNYPLRVTQNYILMTLGAYHYLRDTDVANPAAHENNRILARQLVRQVAMQATVAGMFGSVMWGPIGAALSATSPLTGVNSDDAEDYIRAGLSDVVGPEWSQFILRGGLRALGSDFGGGIGERLSHSNLWFNGALGSKIDDWNSALGKLVGGAGLDTIAHGVHGVSDVFTGARRYADGQTTAGSEQMIRGTQEAVPVKLFADVIKTMANLYLGQHTPGGVPKAPAPDTAEVVSNLLGLRTGKQAERGEQVGAFIRRKKDYEAKVSELKHGYAMGSDEEKRQIRDNLKYFNENLPKESWVTVPDLMKYDRTYRKAQATPPEQAGMTLSKRTRPLWEQVSGAYVH